MKENPYTELLREKQRKLEASIASQEAAMLEEIEERKRGTIALKLRFEREALPEFELAKAAIQEFGKQSVIMLSDTIGDEAIITSAAIRIYTKRDGNTWKKTELELKGTDDKTEVEVSLRSQTKGEEVIGVIAPKADFREEVRRYLSEFINSI